MVDKIELTQNKSTSKIQAFLELKTTTLLKISKIRDFFITLYLISV